YALKSSGGVTDLDLNLPDFMARVNSDLVGKFVNIASRCAGFIEKRFGGQLAAELDDPAMVARFVEALDAVRGHYLDDDAAAAVRAVMALADEANRYVDEKKPWVIAKAEGGDAELQRVCTQGLNLFRLLAIGLKPILPALCARAEGFLDAPVTGWADAAAPLLGRAIRPYEPLLTRIEHKQIDTMIDASKDSLAAAAEAAKAAAATTAPASVEKAAKPAAPKAEPAKPATTAPAEAGAPAFIGIEDFARLDLRIGKVLECGFVEGSDKLLRFKLDAGELGERQIFSGIRASYGEPEKLVGRSVVFIANLAPRKMRFGLSEGMILSAGFDGGALALLDVDSGALPGMPVR
ncbi:MAG: methionine--tRNA ligase subunit beta, partial [Lysobacteraceae bacterium]